MKKENVFVFWAAVAVFLVSIGYLGIETMMVETDTVAFLGDTFLIACFFFVSFTSLVFIGAVSAQRKHVHTVWDIKDGAVLQLEMFRLNPSTMYGEAIVLINNRQYILDIYKGDFALPEAMKQDAKFFKKGGKLYEMK